MAIGARAPTSCSLIPNPPHPLGCNFPVCQEQASSSYVQLPSRAQHPHWYRPRNTGEVGSESFNFIRDSFLEGSKVFLINNNTLASAVLADGSWWFLPKDSKLDKRSLQVHVRGSAVPGSADMELAGNNGCRGDLEFVWCPSLSCHGVVPSGVLGEVTNGAAGALWMRLFVSAQLWPPSSQSLAEAHPKKQNWNER